MLFSFLKSSFQFKGSTSSGEGPVEPSFEFFVGNGFVVEETEDTKIRDPNPACHSVQNRSISSEFIFLISNSSGKIEAESVNSFFSLSEAVEAKKGLASDGSVVLVSE